MQALMEIVRDIYDFARSNPLPDQYIKQDMWEMYDVAAVDASNPSLLSRPSCDDIELQLEGAKEIN